MTTLLRRAISTVRVWLGLGDASDERLTPVHGWLLPTPATVAVRELAAVRPQAEVKSRPRG
jgi:hypothetical protein